MTEDQEAHLERVKTFFRAKVDPKYRLGQLEHGGDVWKKATLPHLIEEAIDQVVYVQCLQENIGDCVVDLADARDRQDWNKVNDVLHRLSEQLLRAKG